jgi:hypothetical protein
MPLMLLSKGFKVDQLSLSTRLALSFLCRREGAYYYIKAHGVQREIHTEFPHTVLHLMFRKHHGFGFGIWVWYLLNAVGTSAKQPQWLRGEARNVFVC